MQITLNISYSLASEVERVFETLEKILWYRKHGYADKLTLPPGVTLSESFVSAEVERAVSMDYQEELYLDSKTQIEESFEEVTQLPGFSNAPLKFESSYNVKLTRYGTGGSYHVPNTIVINIARMKAPIPAILHEMLHLAIEPLIAEHSVTQQNKERVVDLLFKNIFPSYAYEQARFAVNPQVNEMFEKHYPNISVLIESVSG